MRIDGRRLFGRDGVIFGKQAREPRSGGLAYHVKLHAATRDDDVCGILVDRDEVRNLERFITGDIQREGKHKLRHVKFSLKFG